LPTYVAPKPVIVEIPKYYDQTISYTVYHSQDFRRRLKITFKLNGWDEIVTAQKVPALLGNLCNGNLAARTLRDRWDESKYGGAQNWNDLEVEVKEDAVTEQKTEKRARVKIDEYYAYPQQKSLSHGRWKTADALMVASGSVTLRVIASGGKHPLHTMLPYQWAVVAPTSTITQLSSENYKELVEKNVKETWSFEDMGPVEHYEIDKWVVKLTKLT
jgi:hypothetical protein